MCIISTIETLIIYFCSCINTILKSFYISFYFIFTNIFVFTMHLWTFAFTTNLFI